MAPSLFAEADDSGGGVVALRALAAFLDVQPSEGSRGVGDIGSINERLRRGGSESALRALKAFEDAGRRCLKELDEGTVDAIRRCRVEGLATAASSRPSSGGAADNEEVSLVGVSDEEIAKIKLMFDHFDTDKTGLLGSAQFKRALLELGLGAQMSDTEVDALVDIADKNRDGAINLQEFTEWLYGGRGDEEPSPSNAKQADAALRKQLAEARKEVQALAAELRRARAALAEAEGDRGANVEKVLSEAEEAFDRDTEASLEFWRCICNESAAPVLGSIVELPSAQLLGNGKYGFVFKSRRRETDVDVVIKLMSVRWAHVACKEWQQAQAVGGHHHIVKYEDALLHHDADECLAEMLRVGQDAGKLQGRSKRTKFPDKYIVLIEEFMNRGTVQDWMDKEMLYPGGVLVVMQRVASALAFMHSKGITHNDIKPENVLLHQDDEDDPRAEVVVKLADLGLAKYSKDRAADFQQYGLTVHAMMTGERFGTRKFRPEMAPEFTEEVASLLDGVGMMVDGTLSRTLQSLPRILASVWAQETTMQDVEEHPDLQGWSFFEGEGDEEEEPPESVEVKPLRRMTRSLVPETVRSIGQVSARYASEFHCDGD